jgi:hypothetical protein
MRKLLTLTCCVGLASLVGAAQHDDQNGNQGKKKGGQQQQQQAVVAPQTGKKFKTTGTGTGPHTQNFQQPNTVGTGAKFKKFHGTGQGNPTGANTTTFNKTKNVNINKNVTVNKNFKFQKQQFNLQTNKVFVGKYKTVNYNANYKFVGFKGGNPKLWGSKYVVFANYHPLWHDTWWWNSYHGSHIVFIFGGWYYWDNSYWYPAWGYAPNAVYYYDGPIYASNPSDDPGQVVANVQSALQQQGYYQGDIDGVLGPQTRAALAEYQSAQGLEPTGAVDEPTLETLGMA